MPSYAAVLRTPHAVRTFGSALLGRLSYGIVYLALMLAVIRATGSYSVAGVFVALFGLTSGVLSPVRARIIDRHGPSRALPPMAAVYASALTALAVATWHPGTTPDLLLYGLSAVAGSSTPPLGPIMRSLWSDLLPEPALRQRAFSLDTVAEEVLYIVGPLLAGAVAALTNPALGVVLSAILILTGSLLLAMSPPARPRPAADIPARAPAPAVSTGASARTSGFRVVAHLYRPILISASAGMCLGALSLLVVAAARNANHLAAVAWIEAALAVGSVAGGLAYGAVTWRMPGSRRLPLLAAGLGTSFAVAGLSANLYVLAALVGVIGLFVSPSLTTAYLLADETATPETRTQAGAWVNTAFNLANSAGTALIGLLLAGLSLPVCFAIAATPPLLAALSTSVRRPSRRAASLDAMT
ncbi:MFS transporter [Actinoplanes derwentensis]|uniref:Major Facilitator Superfamily protein n=1 Tax=Actinoplanes derwentensis TaxID=113562 RepID=A0A1H2CLX2_9ACTN|nr:MFS transporter [Actinoplanes derwentensis]GID86150.1 MFS transporter [Actinoplanes derwentensis]SDT71545.1 Major Facilitator Superfamily protein [Actinoplanes derwentensis]